MHCIKCGTAIPEGSLYCPECGNAVQMVSDYSSLEGILADEVGDVMDDDSGYRRTPSQRRTGNIYARSERSYDDIGRSGRLYGDGERYNDSHNDVNRYDRGYDSNRSGRLYESGNRYEESYDSGNRYDRQYKYDRSERLYSDSKISNTSYGRNSYQYEETGRAVNYDDRERSDRQRSDRQYDDRYRDSRDVNNRYHSSEGYRSNNRREAAREAAEKKKKKMIMIIAAVAVVVIVLIIVLISSLSKGTLSSQMKKAEKALSAENYESALNEFNEAASIDTESAEPYIGMAKAYIGLGDTDSAIAAYKTGISVDGTCSEAYIALAELYISLDDYDAVTNMFVSVTDKTVLKECSDYIAEVPSISPAGGEYTDTVTVTISAGYGTIRYTMDGSMPDRNSPEYSEPIVLNDNNSYSIRAITINSLGISSKDACEEFKMNIPSPDGPSVSPSSGTYNEATKITVSIPDNSTVYYTLDGTDPTENSTVYSGPIDMPEGQSTFSCIAVNKNGKTSSIIRRQYNYLVLK